MHTMHLLNSIQKLNSKKFTN